MHRLWIVLLIGCGGSSPAPQQPQPQPAPPPQVQPAAPAGLTADVCAQKDDDFGPVKLREDQVALRRGTGVTRFADLVSTRETPIEVCSPREQRAWLGSVACNDGPPKAAPQRSGSVGPGGTCGSIIDLYLVDCPEKQYEVFMDMYMCPPGQGL